MAPVPDDVNRVDKAAGARVRFPAFDVRVGGREGLTRAGRRGWLLPVLARVTRAGKLGVVGLGECVGRRAAEYLVPVDQFERGALCVFAVGRKYDDGRGAVVKLDPAATFECKRRKRSVSIDRI